MSDESDTLTAEMRKLDAMLATASADSRADARLLGDCLGGAADTFEHRLARYLDATRKEWMLRHAHASLSSAAFAARMETLRPAGRTCVEE